MTDVLLINPGDRKMTFQELGKDFAAIETPYWVVSIASFLRNNKFSVEVIDSDVENYTPEKTAKKVIEIKPKLIAIISHGSTPQSSTLNMYPAGKITKAIKQLCNIPIAISGIHPTALPEKTLEEEKVDFVIIGEGPNTLKYLAEAIKNKERNFKKIQGLCFYDEDKILVKNNAAPLVENIDQTMGTAAWDLIPMEKYRSHFWHSYEDIKKTQPYASIYTALGCKYNCSFCQVNALFGKPGMRFREPENVVNEIGMLVEKYGVRNLKISDELFVNNEGRHMKILDMLIERGYDLNMWVWSRIDTMKTKDLERMKKAGVNWAVYGIESADINVRREIGKPIRPDVEEIVKATRESGVSVVANYIFGLPEDNMESMKTTYEQAERINAEEANFYAAQAYPGTRLYTQALKKGWKLPEKWSGFSHHSYDCLPVQTNYLSSADVLKFRDDSFYKYHTSKKYLHMIKEKFGQNAVDTINKITSVKLKRQILGD